MIPQAATKHIVIVAGEASGDHHGATLIQQLKALRANYQFSGIGGARLEQAGMLLLSDLARHGVTGVIEVLRHARVIRAAYKKLQQHLTEIRPELLILIDYPGFNLRIAKFAKQKLGIKILYYISPQIWAWKANRIHTIAKNIDHMAVILPFEKVYYEKARVPVSFVGHPLVERVAAIPMQHPLRATYQLPENKKIIALLPGSRINEVEQHMPVFYQYAKKMSKKHDNLHFVIPVAETLESARLKKHWPDDSRISYSLIKGHALEVAYCSDVIIVASGTASLECALLNKPMCIIYKVSLFTYLLATKFIRVKYLGLCNLLLNQMAVPELLQYDFNAEELFKISATLLYDQDYIKHMHHKLTAMQHQLSSAQRDISLVDLVEKMLES
jgi:lipid-A-disaccharide synthase